MIPRIFHTYWEGDRPAWVDDNLQRVRDLHPDWLLAQWSPSNHIVLDCLLPDFGDPKVAPRHKVAYRSNLVRYSSLWQMGGVWLDSDMVVFDSLEPLREHRAFLPAGVHNPQVCVMGSEPYHPFIGRVIRAARDDYPSPHRICSGVRHVDIAGTHDVELVPQDVIFVPNTPDAPVPAGVLAAHLKEPSSGN